VDQPGLRAVIDRRGRTLAVGLAVAILAAGTLAAGWFALAANGCGLPQDPSCLRVLFIGNSYTSVNDLPGTFARLARSGGRRVEVASIAPGGAFLADHAASTEVASTIGGRGWTAVVLQEQSELPAATDLVETRIVPPAATLVARIDTAGARPWLLETWAHRDGWPDRHLDRAAMQAAIDATYRELAGRLGATVVPAGEAWARALREAPAIALWQADGSHPTAAGTYLAACVLYASLVGRSPAGLAETGGLSSADAALLQRIAAEP
jgi:hypothetical protein